jgi:hypothetical protein
VSFRTACWRNCFRPGHSSSDILIYVPQERLLVSGAVVYQRAHFPEIGEETRLQDIHRFLAVLDRFLADDGKIDRVVPSRSPPLLKSDLAPVRDYYQRMFTRIQAAPQKGLTLEQTMRRRDARTNFPALYDRPPGVWSHGFDERNVKNLWRILNAEQQPSPADTGKTVSMPPEPSANRNQQIMNPKGRLCKPSSVPVLQRAAIISLDQPLPTGSPAPSAAGRRGSGKRPTRRLNGRSRSHPGQVQFFTDRLLGLAGGGVFPAGDVAARSAAARRGAIGCVFSVALSLGSPDSTTIARSWKPVPGGR